MTRRAFVVCGPESSGNRLVGAILVRAGCAGEGSTNQPKEVTGLPAGEQVVWIKHHRLESHIKDLRHAGFTDVTLVIVIREPEANVRSMVKVGHSPDTATAFRTRLETIQAALSAGFTFGAKIEIITYEGLSTEMLRSWLGRLGLRCDNLNEPLPLVGQDRPRHIQNQNFKHYV